MGHMSYQPCARVWMFFAKNLFGPESSCECFFPQKCCQIQIFGSPTQHLMHFFYLQNEHFMSLLIASTQNLYGILHFFYITYIRQHTYIYILIAPIAFAQSTSSIVSPKKNIEKFFSGCYVLNADKKIWTLHPETRRENMSHISGRNFGIKTMQTWRIPECMPNPHIAGRC